MEMVHGDGGDGGDVTIDCRASADLSRVRQQKQLERRA
jgi:hypothetical protein